MAAADNNLTSILADVAKVLGKGNKRGSAHSSTSMHLASSVPCLQTHQNPAVQRCCDLRNGILCEALTEEERQQFDEGFLRLYDLFEKEINEDSKSYQIANTASLAYRTAMPEPTTRRSIKSFIACVLHAMAINILDPEEGAKLLSGARAATLALSRRAPNKSKQKKQKAAFEPPIDPEASRPQEPAVSLQ